jgi:hypothetical protein
MLTDMMTPHNLAARIPRSVRRREYILPCRIGGRCRVLFRKRVRQIYLAKALAQVLSMQSKRNIDLRA